MNEFDRQPVEAWLIWGLGALLGAARTMSREAAMDALTAYEDGTDDSRDEGAPRDEAALIDGIR